MIPIVLVVQPGFHGCLINKVVCYLLCPSVADEVMAIKSINLGLLNRWHRITIRNFWDRLKICLVRLKSVMEV